MTGRSFTVLAVLAALMPLAPARSIVVPIAIQLNAADAAKSFGLAGGKRFPVGYGRDGFSGPGTRFQGGVSLLGFFSVNAIFSEDRFEMTPELIAQSGKSEAWLREHLFANMSAIDFDGDGAGGEYGAGFISLEPTGTTPQPFAFNEYQGVFRWYSYAIHGTQDQARIGRKITGGCINVGADDLAKLLETVKLGDVVTVEAAK